MREYARLDKRIIAVFQSPNDNFQTNRFRNWTPDFERYILRLMFYLEPEDWLSMLDADDDDEPDFLEEMLRFAADERLDYVACRSNFIHEPDGTAHNRVVLEHDIVAAGEGFGTLFPEYFRYICVYWAKLQKGSLFRRINRANYDHWMDGTGLTHRTDTAMELYLVQYAQRLGVRAKLLHNYHVYPFSHSREAAVESQLRENDVMVELYRELLRGKVGCVSEENERYIQEIHARARRTLMENGRL